MLFKKISSLSFKWKVLFFLLLMACSAFAQDQATDLVSQVKGVASQQGGPPSVTIQMMVLAGLSVLPFAIMLFTSYLKIVIVLSLIRNALGVQQTPPNQIINGIALILSFYVMFPTGVAMYAAAEPQIKTNAPTELVSSNSAYYIIDVMDKAKEPMREFLQKNSSLKHINSFFRIAFNLFPEPYRSKLKPSDYIVLMPSFITSQLKAAFEIGVMIYLPFFVIDLVVSNILLAMGMMMLSPLTISLPIKLLLLVMIDGWTLLVQGLILTFR